jgi:hypothetical protein
MEMPSQVTPAFWGANCGAWAFAIVGFSWGGWVSLHLLHVYGGARYSLAGYRDSGLAAWGQFLRSKQSP